MDSFLSFSLLVEMLLCVTPHHFLTPLIYILIILFEIVYNFPEIVHTSYTTVIIIFISLYALDFKYLLIGRVLTV